MFYKPDLFFYVLLFPVFIMVVVPALWSILGIMYRSASRSRLADVSGFLEVDMQRTANEVIERRQEPRVKIEGPKAILSVHEKCCKSEVENISQNGICFSCLPLKKFKELESRFMVMFRSRNKDFTMLVEPKWSQKQENGMLMGAEIISAPYEWQKFVRGLC